MKAPALRLHVGTWLRRPWVRDPRDDRLPSYSSPGSVTVLLPLQVCGVLIAQLKSLIEADSSGAGKKCDLANQVWM